MSLEFYHYVHCPFCVRVRMTFGLLNIPYTSHVIRYDDEETPVQLTGKKMLPILKHESGAMNESLDIMKFLDKTNTLRISETTADPSFKEFEAYLNFIGGPVHSLAMPYWIYTPEFDEASRNYFKNKKEEKRGPFNKLVQNQNQFIGVLANEFKNLSLELRPFYKSSTFGLKDILLAAHLWGLYVVPEFQFPLEIHNYLQSVKKLCQFNYHQDFWR